MPTDNTPKDQNTAEDYQNLFILAKTPSKPFLTRNNILAALACAISLRPLFFTFADESGPILLELCLNLAAWIAVVAAYKFVSKNSIRKRWWVVASGAVSFLTLYTLFGLEHSNALFTAILIIAPYVGLENPLSLMLLPTIICLLSPVIIILSRDRTRSVIIAITTLLLLTLFFPFVWFVVFFVYTALFGFV